MTWDQVARFWSHVKWQYGDRCWIWQAGNCRGYGHFYLSGRTFKASRIAYYLQTGIDPGDKQICHTCDNPFCCNPKHLWIGTSKDNNQDKTKKGRQAREEKHGRSKLTTSDILIIKSASDNTVVLAKQFGVGNAIIGKIQRGILWPDVAPHLTRKSKRPGLTPDIIREIRQSNLRNYLLARKFHISDAMVHNIKNKLAWRGIE